MKLPEISHFFLETPLYERFEIDESDGKKLFDLIYFQGKLDSYCPFCGKESTFVGNNDLPSFFGHTHWTYETMVSHANQDYRLFLNRSHQINLYCSRVEKHLMQQIIFITDHELLKIGQYPSLAEVSQPELKKYRHALSKEKYAELNRGIGLITHGVGIGAFVYLRRIFEDLIEEAHNIVRKEKEWNEDIYIKARMSERIELLRLALPEFLVSNKSLYSILSIGIHELTENDCKDYFPTVKLGIELILDEKLERQQKQDKIEAAKSSIAKINSGLSAKGK